LLKASSRPLASESASPAVSASQCTLGSSRCVNSESSRLQDHMDETGERCSDVCVGDALIHHSTIAECYHTHASLPSCVMPSCITSNVCIPVHTCVMSSPSCAVCGYSFCAALTACIPGDWNCQCSQCRYGDVLSAILLGQSSGLSTRALRCDADVRC
jgi:hypothetical protein